jgi:carboxylesterase type B
VNAFIPESGTATSFINPPLPDNTQAWFNASQKLGCGGSSVGVEQSLACVRTKSTSDILTAIAVANPLQAVLGNFGPTSDNKVVFSDYNNRASSGQFIKRPYFTGSNNYEAGLFRILAAAGGINISDVDWCLFNLERFTCPAAKAANARAVASVPSYRYRYYGEFPNLRLTVNPNSGAWHGSEVPIVWGTAVDASGIANTAAEDSISTYLQGAWAAFAKDPTNAFTKAPYSFPKFNALSTYRFLILLATG